VEVTPPLNEHEISYLTSFNETRRMARKKGPYFVGGTGFHGQGNDDDIENFNGSGEQPGLWCQWVPSQDGTLIEWDQGEKFYSSAEWMKYLIDNFLKPGAVASQNLAASIEQDPRFEHFTFDHVVNGEIEAQGEDHEDKWKLIVQDNKVSVASATVTFLDPVEL
jgi:hypothetical protein